MLLFPSLNKLNVGIIIIKPTIELALQICMSQMSSMFNQVFFAVVWSLYKSFSFHTFQTYHQRIINFRPWADSSSVITDQLGWASPSGTILEISQ